MLWGDFGCRALTLLPIYIIYISTFLVNVTGGSYSHFHLLLYYHVTVVTIGKLCTTRGSNFATKAEKRKHFKFDNFSISIPATIKWNPYPHFRTKSGYNNSAASPWITGKLFLMPWRSPSSRTISGPVLVWAKMETVCHRGHCTWCYWEMAGSK